MASTRTVASLLAEAGEAERAADWRRAAGLWVRLLHHDPADLAWRLRLTLAMQNAGDPESADLQLFQLYDAAFEGHPLFACIVAHSADAHPDEPHEPGMMLRDYLAGSPKLGKVARAAPPVLSPADTSVADADDDEPPDRPARPHVGPLPPMPLLSLLEPEAFEALWPHMSRRGLLPGEVLMAEGEPADALYLVGAGVLEVTRDDPDRPRVTLGRVAEGAVLGEMALVLSRPRTATVTALTAVETLRIDVEALRAVADQVPAVQAALSEFTRQRVIQLLLATSPLFRDLEPPARAALLQVFAVRDLPEGAVITRQGGEGKALRLIVSGGVDIWRSESGEEAARVARLGPGEVFGEIALLTGQPATATVVAAAPTTVLELTRPVLDDVCRAHPSIQERLTRIGEQRLAENRFIFQDDDFFEEAE